MDDRVPFSFIFVVHCLKVLGLSRPFSFLDYMRFSSFFFFLFPLVVYCFLFGRMNLLYKTTKIKERVIWFLGSEFGINGRVVDAS